MRLTKSLAVAASTLALAAGAAFAGEGPLSYEQGGPEVMYEVYDVYIVPADEIVLIPLEDPSQAPIAGNELG